MFFTIAIAVLVCICLLFHLITKETVDRPKHREFSQLQLKFLCGYCLAAFSDWLQGPYIYKVYESYGFDEQMIAILYLSGFISSSIFGTLVGSFADIYGKKSMCILYSFFYSVCCMTKFFQNFFLLMIGRIFGGIATSILFTSFEAWYVNEHLNYYRFPSEWLNITLTKAVFYNSILAIVAGVFSQILVYHLNLKPVAPFGVAIIFLILGGCLIACTWKENMTKTPEKTTSVLKSMKESVRLILAKNRRELLVLGVIQSLFESVMYIFIFAWTPILSTENSKELNDSLGLIFSCFMLACMIGPKVYAYLLSKSFSPEKLLSLTLSIACVILGICLIFTVNFFNIQNGWDKQICFVLFLVYEFSIGMYYPAVSYIRSLIIPEKFRASVSNWFRFPTNLITCLAIIWVKPSKLENMESVSDSSLNITYISFIFLPCSLLLLGATILSCVYEKKFAACRKEYENMQNVV